MGHVLLLLAVKQRIAGLQVLRNGYGRLFGDASTLDIANYLGVKMPQTRKYMASLKDKGICEKVGLYNPVTYALTKRFKEEFGIVSAPEENAG